MKNLAKRELTPRVQEVVNFVFDHPDYSYKRLGQELHLSNGRISQILRSDRVIAMYPIFAKKRYQNLVPAALKAQGDLIKQKANLMVQDKASARVLESINILNSNPVTNINIYAGLTNDDLMRKIDQSKQIPQQSIDAELDDGQ